MSDVEEDDSDRELRRIEAAIAATNHRIERVEPIFTHAINTLWAGNGAASLAALGAISATFKDHTFDRRALWPLGFFLAGLIFMCIGTLYTLVRESGDIKKDENARDLLDFQAANFRSPTERAGLTFRNLRTFCAFCAGVCFIAGCGIGFAMLVCFDPQPVALPTSISK